MILSFAFAPRVRHRFEAALPLRQLLLKRDARVAPPAIAPRLPASSKWHRTTRICAA